jgi:glycosyltransferase involved in cell wall biosynthesis
MSAAPVRVTGALFAYNHAPYVAAALRSALAQTYPMQLLVFDDGSRDDTARILREVLAGHRSAHDIRLVEHASNRGFAATINEAMELATGELVVEFAGDDISRPHRVARLVQAFMEHGRRCHALGSGYRAIDERGAVLYEMVPAAREEWTALDIAGGERQCVVGATMAWRPEVFAHFGPLPADNRLEDVAICFRAGIVGTIRYVPEVLVDYRLHGQSGSREMWPVSRIDTFEDFRSSKAREARELGHIVSHHEAVLRRVRDQHLLDEGAASRVERFVEEYRAKAAYVAALASGSRLDIARAALRAQRWPALRYEARRALLLVLVWRRYGTVIGWLRRLRSGLGRRLGRDGARP